MNYNKKKEWGPGLETSVIQGLRALSALLEDMISQHPHQVVHISLNSSSRIVETLLPAFTDIGTHVVHIHTFRHTDIHINHK